MTIVKRILRDEVEIVHDLTEKEYGVLKLIKTTTIEKTANNATVIVECFFGNGTSKTDNIHLRKEGDDWKIDPNHHYRGNDR